MSFCRQDKMLVNDYGQSPSEMEKGIQTGCLLVLSCIVSHWRVLLIENSERILVD